MNLLDLCGHNILYLSSALQLLGRMRLLFLRDRGHWYIRGKRQPQAFRVSPSVANCMHNLIIYFSLSNCKHVLMHYTRGSFSIWYVNEGSNWQYKWWVEIDAYVTARFETISPTINWPARLKVGQHWAYMHYPAWPNYIPAKTNCILATPAYEWPATAREWVCSSCDALVYVVVFLFCNRLYVYMPLALRV